MYRLSMIAAALSSATLTNATVASATVAFVAGHAAPAYAATEHGEPTTIEQRDDAGVVRVRRQVRLNARGDFENHGAYREWSADGRLIGQGRYADGRRTGVWRRWAAIDELPEATAAWAAGFEGPLLSQSQYRDGRLVSEWRVMDAAGRVVLKIGLARGKRQGDAVFYAPDGSIVRHARFENGVPVGDVQRRGADGALTRVAEFRNGREHQVAEEAYPSGARLSRQELLGPIVRVTTPDDPWRFVLATYAQHGEPIRHGERTVWHENGRQKHTARYASGKPIGEFRWWRPNGQLAAAGSYDTEGATGVWRWWGETGLLSARAEYRGGQLVGQLAAWDARGRRKATRLRQPTPPRQPTEPRQPAELRDTAGPPVQLAGRPDDRPEAR